MTTKDTLSRKELLARIARLETESARRRDAALVHLATIEDMQRTIDRLTAQLHGTDGTRDGTIKRLTDENNRLIAEHARLRTELQHATDAWQTYQGPATAARELYRFARWAIPQLGQQRAPFVPTVIQGRKTAPVVG